MGRQNQEPPKELIDKMIAFYISEKGISASQTAREFGVTTGQALKHLKLAGVYRNPKNEYVIAAAKRRVERPGRLAACKFFKDGK